MLKSFFNKYERLVPDNPIYSKFNGTCKVCGKDYYKGEQISPYFDQEYNFWRHTTCYQLFYLILKYESQCNDCNQELDTGSCSYWSKHNGVWCTVCAEKLFPKVTVAYSRDQKHNNFIRKNKPRKDHTYGE